MLVSLEIEAIGFLLTLLIKATRYDQSKQAIHGGVFWS
jgi:hypothetical protein